MAGKEPTTHRTSNRPWNVPLGLVGHPWEYPMALAFAATLILIYVAELATPTDVVIATLGLVPIVAAAWLLSTPLAVGITVLGIGLAAVAGAVGALVPFTAAAGAGVFTPAAVAIRLYAPLPVLLLRGTPDEAEPGPSLGFGLERLGQVVVPFLGGVAALVPAGPLISGH